MPVGQSGGDGDRAAARTKGTKGRKSAPKKSRGKKAKVHTMRASFSGTPSDLEREFRFFVRAAFRTEVALTLERWLDTYKAAGVACPREHAGLERLVQEPHQGKKPWMGQDVAFLAQLLEKKAGGARQKSWGPSVSVWSVVCPTCGARERESCIHPTTHTTLTYHHRARREAARAAWRAASKPRD